MEIQNKLQLRVDLEFGPADHPLIYDIVNR